MKELFWERKELTKTQSLHSATMQMILFRVRKMGVKSKVLEALCPGTQTYLIVPRGHGPERWETGSLQVLQVLKSTDISS